MNEKTNLEKTVLAAEGDPKLDRAVKELLADKQVLARILKRVTDEFIGEDFRSLRKVYSIWICMDPPDYAENSIVRFSLKPEVLTGNFPSDKLNSMKYDLIDVVLVFLSTGKSIEKDELC